MDKHTYMADVAELVKQSYQDGWQSSGILVKPIAVARDEKDDSHVRFPMLESGSVANGISHCLDYQRPRKSGFGSETINFEWGLLRILPGYEDADEVLADKPSFLQGYFQLKRIGEISGIFLSTTNFEHATAYRTYGSGLENWIETQGIYILDKVIPRLLRTAPLSKITDYGKGTKELLG